jgi:hypothetical protein
MWCSGLIAAPRARPSYQPHVFSYLREQIPQTEPLNIVEYARPPCPIGPHGH